MDAVILALVAAIFGSTGLWTLINNIYQSRKEKKSVEREALLGLLHESLAEKCEAYIAAGSISRQDFEDLEKYIYKPYRKLGGNGTGEVLFNKVSDLVNNRPAA